MSPQKLSLCGVGDVGVRRDNPESIFALAEPTLKEADILFGQMEHSLSQRGAAQTHTVHRSPPHPRNIAALTHAGFDVMSLASNHCLDWGEDALLDTIDILRKNSITAVGAGKNIDEARQPAIIERNGTKIAFLAYCSVLPKGYEALPYKPGCAPMRASTFYEQVDWQPATPPRIISWANKEDLEELVEDVRKVRPLADVVVMSLHWGVHIVPAVIAMYQKEVGYAAIDAGVDLILGHHAHILKGIEVYKGKVIFYSLCNFARDHSVQALRRGFFRRLYGWELDPEYPSYAYPADSRKTIIAKCVISDKKIEKVSYLPVMINKQSQPEVLRRSDKRSREVFDYIEWCCKDQKLDTRFSGEGDEVVIAARKSGRKATS